MKIALASDLHLEFGSIELNNTDNAQVLILAGDIMISQDLYDHPATEVSPSIEATKLLGSRQKRAQLYRDFLKNCSNQFPYVIYVAGNHEFYHGRWYQTLDILREECEKFPNIYFLENNLKTIDDVTFVGSTLWTDMNKGDPMTIHAVTDMVNDFKVIRNDKKEYTKLRPFNTISRHRDSVEYIRTVIEGKFDEKFVVVTHMAPTWLSIHPRFKHSYLMNGAYASDLSDFILDHPQIKLWCHGHVHDPFDYPMGETRVLCNPRGYHGSDISAENFKLKYLDI